MPLTERISVKTHTKIISVGKILSFNIKSGGKYSKHGAVRDSSALSGVYFLLLFFLFRENAKYIFRLILGFISAISIPQTVHGDECITLSETLCLTQVTT
jgi:hypothetical protein